MPPDDGYVDYEFPVRDLVEESWNAATHGAGLILSVVATVGLARMCSHLDPWIATACAAYGLLLVLVYAVSTLSHAVHTARAKQLLRTWDQGLIFFFIAATYTPLVLAYVPSTMAAVSLILIWIAAVLGMVSKVVVQHRVNTLATWGYLLLGWGPAIVLMWFVPWGCLAWLFLGGLSYTVGVCFLKVDGRYRYFHAAWHVCVILGSICHYVAIMAFVVMS